MCSNWESVALARRVEFRGSYTAVSRRILQMYKGETEEDGDGEGEGEIRRGETDRQTDRHRRSNALGFPQGSIPSQGLVSPLDSEIKSFQQIPFLHPWPSILTN